MSLDAAVNVTFADFTLAVEIACAPGETVAVVGRNGSGKTTLLRAIAGLRPIDSGRVVLDGVTLDGLAPEERSVGFAFQDNLLFPHLDVLDNVAFGPRARGVKPVVARQRATEWLERVGLAAQAHAWPGQLSGGQAQRVALARALAIEPGLLLLDEPLASLDAATRNDVRRVLREHLAAFAGPRLLVTHDPIDAAVLADRVVVLEAGRVVQTGTPGEITARPRHAWVADLAGTNLYRGTAAGRLITLDGGGRLHAADATASGDVYAAVSPRAVALHREPPDSSARNRWEGRVTAIEPVGGRLRVRIEATPPITAEITGAAGDELALVDGSPVWVTVKATEVDVYPA
jgi:molybdate transport system ATP-binding protein